MSNRSSYQDKRTAIPADLQERTLVVQNYGSNVNKEIITELFTQGAPVRKVHFKPSFSYIEFEDSESVAYCLALFDGVELFGRPLQFFAKLPNERTNFYLTLLRNYENDFAQDAYKWWNRFGDSTKPMPKHICKYSANNNQFNYQQMMLNQMPPMSTAPWDVATSSNMNLNYSNFGLNNYPQMMINTNFIPNTFPNFDDRQLNYSRRSFNDNQKNNMRDNNRNDSNYFKKDRDERKERYKDRDDRNSNSSLGFNKRKNRKSPNNKGFKKVRKHESF